MRLGGIQILSSGLFHICVGLYNYAGVVVVVGIVLWF